MTYNNTRDGDGDGSTSKWHEGTFKNIRLHEAQQLINVGKMEPLKKNTENWNYEIWISGITILYGEGQSKYSTPEIEEIEKIKELLYSMIQFCPPYKLIFYTSINKRTSSYKLDPKKWDRLRKHIELYEQKVKHLNDLHGLSTGNVDGDLEGL